MDWIFDAMDMDCADALSYSRNEYIEKVEKIMDHYSEYRIGIILDGLMSGEEKKIEQAARMFRELERRFL